MAMAPYYICQGIWGRLRKLNISLHRNTFFVFPLGKFLLCPDTNYVENLLPEKNDRSLYGFYAMTAVAGWSAGPYIGEKY